MPTLIKDIILEKIYAGFLVKAIGVRLGAPVEPTIWTYERIAKTYGEITGYLRDFKNFAADDDTNGPIYFIRAMRDYGVNPTAEDVGKTWLNYAAQDHGMYWWGGFGVSSEHTAYCNLRAGIPAPQSGSMAQNGAIVAQQIGGQIFIDSWGWVHAGQPQNAADAAARAASVAHDGEGLNGARFCAAAIAQAFLASSVSDIIHAAMATLDPTSIYARVVQAVREFHAQNPDDWRACRQMLEDQWGYDRYPGVCHIIPNAGVTVMAILYGDGKLPRTVEIATMAGWDTDCNAGTAGAIIGTFEGVQPSWDRYRTPINDVVIASGVAGSLNIVDIASFARELTVLALKLRGDDVPDLWRQDFTRRGVRFDFDLPGSTHGFRAEGFNQISLKASSEKHTESSRGALEIRLDRLERGQGGRIFWKPFYRRSDFDDDRYRPMFTPLVDSGQRVAFKLWLDPWNGDGNLRVVPYVRRAMSGRIEEIGGWHIPDCQGWQDYTYVIPEGVEAIDEIGIKVEHFGRLKYLGRLFLAEFKIEGAGHTRIDPRNEVEEWGAISRFTWNRGHWTLQDGRIHAHTDSDADMWTGHYYARDITILADIQPLVGRSHLVIARAKGTSQFYAAGFEGDEVVILKQDFGTTVLARAPFAHDLGQSYAFSFCVKGDTLSFAINGVPLITARDTAFAYGMAGVRLGALGRMSVGMIEIIETP